LRIFFSQRPIHKMQRHRKTWDYLAKNSTTIC